MVGILYILLTSITAYIILDKLMPEDYGRINKLKSLAGRDIELAGWMVKLPASYLVGTLIFTWSTYIFAYIFRSVQKPLIWGNTITFLILGVLLISFGALRLRDIKSIGIIGDKKTLSVSRLVNENKLELMLVLFVTFITSYMIFHSFNISDGTMHVGYSVYSDFGPHLSMIRSFSAGSNFPTEYPHFADGHVRYHFFFQFLAGNLEFLGLRLDWAFNLPSILSMLAFLMLLYSFAVILLEKKWTGCLAVVLFMFRSSFAFAAFISEQGSLGKSISAILHGDKHIGKTPYEEWGLWAQKTFINQRHLPFGLGIILLVLIVLYPLFKKMISDLGRYKGEDFSLKGWIKEFAATWDAWIPGRWLRPVLLGIILGLTTFWNGAMVIAVLPVLFIIALLSKHRLEFLIVAVLTVSLSMLQTNFFFGTGSSAVDPKLTIGFVANRKDLLGIILYYIELLGIMPFVAIAGLMIYKKGAGWLAFAFCMPMVLATTLQLTPDIVVNHKYVFVTIILLNIFAAGFLYRVFSVRKNSARVLASLLLAMMLATGVADFITLKNIDKNFGAIQVDDPVKNWVIQNTKPDEIFLTDIHVTHPILLAGRKLYYGWPYFAWSAGYDTDSRDRIVKQIYGGTDPNEVRRLAVENGIDYIVIENGNRDVSKGYKLNEELIRNNFKLAYKNEQNQIEIYRTK
jgi:hypothetical protein